jgi:hypothetical protein
MQQEDRSIEAYVSKPTDTPIIKLNRMDYVKVSGKILRSTRDNLEKYIEYASRNLGSGVTAGDCLEHGLNMLFSRDAGFKKWLKR